jgi:CubicO group peptidase (beta-lactamase class C family)
MRFLRRRDLLNTTGRAVLASALLPAVASSQEHESNDRASWETLINDLEKQIPKLLAENLVPGLSIALIRDAKLGWRRAFGVRDSGTRKPLDNDTVFEAASMGKPVFAYAVMKLCERGVLDLDAPLTKYTPERYLEGDARLDLITARHVLSHTSGFQNWRSEKEPLSIHFTPGEKFLYSGEGYTYLQSIVERLTRQTIDAYMRVNVFLPFNMVSAGYVWNDVFEKRMARPHDENGQPGRYNRATAAHVARYGAAGELRLTAADYAKFMIEVIDPKPSDSFRLTKESLKEMVRPQVKVSEENSSALGWQIQHSDRRDYIIHGGDNKGFHSFSAASIDRKAGYIVMTNGENGGAVLKKLMTGLLNPFLAAV